MLSAFVPQPVVELKQRDKSKIESILAHGDRIIVGLNTGSLRTYRVKESQDAAAGGSPTSRDEAASGGNKSRKLKPPVVDLYREEEKFSRKPIQQLAVIREANTLVSLSDGFVNLHELQGYTLTEKLEQSKGATSFAITSDIVKDALSGVQIIVSRLAVTIKRKVIIWSWQDTEIITDELEEFSLPATVKSVVWVSSSTFVAGLDPGFILVDIQSKEMSDINRANLEGEVNQPSLRFGAVNSTGMGYVGMSNWIPKPMATKVNSSNILLAKDVNTLFIDALGAPLDKKQIPWTSTPESIAYSYPFLLALQAPTRGYVEVRNPETLSLLQTISLPNATIIHVPQPNISLAHAGKGFLAASDRCIWKMESLGYDSQVDQLISQHHYDEAISLVGLLEDTLLVDKIGKTRQAKVLKAYKLFSRKQFREALDLFSDACAPPARVITLYPKEIAGELAKSSDSSASSDDDEDGSGSGKSGDSDNENNGRETDGGVNIPATLLSKSPTKPGQETPSRSLLAKFRAEQRKPDVENDSPKVRLTAGTASESVQPGSKSNAQDQETPSADKPLEGKELLIAVNELCAFLAQTRVQLQKYIGFDGELKRASGSESSTPPFAQYIENPDREGLNWQEALREVASLVDTTLFRAYMIARPGLAGSLFRIDNFCDPIVVKEKLYEKGRYADLIDFMHGKKLHAEALRLLERFGRNGTDEEEAPALRGPRRTVLYLQQLPPTSLNLILEFVRWPLRENPDLGMQVFLADTENAETLPRQEVSSFLESISTKLAIRYLEHIIGELGDSNLEFHQRLVELYLQRVIEIDEANKGSSTVDPQRKAVILGLQAFLKSSESYNKAKAFRHIPTEDPDFYECRAIVLSKMGQHKQALFIYVFQLKDYDKAEAYCNNLPPSAVEDAPETGAHALLLTIYLRPPPGHPVNLPAALSLLSRHGARLPAPVTLDLVPEAQPVRELEAYFRGRIRAANARARGELIEARLRAAQKVSLDAALLLGVDRDRTGAGVGSGGGGGVTDGGGAALGGRNRRVIVDEDRRCRVCHKRFGGSAIRVYPDDSVVHYGCVPRQGGRVGVNFGAGKDGS